MEEAKAYINTLIAEYEQLEDHTSVKEKALRKVLKETIANDALPWAEGKDEFVRFYIRHMFSNRHPSMTLRTVLAWFIMAMDAAPTYTVRLQFAVYLGETHYAMLSERLKHQNFDSNSKEAVDADDAVAMIHAMASWVSKEMDHDTFETVRCYIAEKVMSQDRVFELGATTSAGPKGPKLFSTLQERPVVWAIFLRELREKLAARGI